MTAILDYYKIDSVTVISTERRNLLCAKNPPDFKNLEDLFLTLDRHFLTKQ